MLARTWWFAVAVVFACSSPPSTPTTPKQPGWVEPQPVGGRPAPVDPLSIPTPLDPKIKVGKLSNGLTYYVMKHAKPEQRAALWLAVNAGSVQEDNDQRGLAHFVEHMAFNGTKRFPKQAIVDYIEKVGMQFGPDVNAYTTFDHTVYQLLVPTDNRDVMLKGLDILRDWAGDVSFDPVEVDKERGVVLEEWRLGRGAFSRVNDKQWPVIFQGSRYAERLPIGQPEILKTAKRDTLVRYYKDWYRPDMMAVMAVGDFDPVAMEKEIQARFGDLAKPANPRPRDLVKVPRDHDTAVTIVTDPELPFSGITIYDKLDRRPESTKGDYRRFIVENLYHTMLNARFEELALDPAAPFLSAGSGTTSFALGGDLFLRNAQAKENKVLESLAVLLREIERVEKHGFLATELARARRQLLVSAENAAAEWDKTQAPDIADEMTRHFFEGEQMPGRPLELAFNREFLPQITLAELNTLAKTWGGDKGRVIAVSAPAKAKLPTEADIRALLRSAATEKVEAWKDSGDRPLLAKPPAPGKVAATKTNDKLGTTEWKLENGVRVVVKPTTFQNDEIKFEGWSLGGTSLVPDKDYVHARFADSIVGASGVADLDPITLRKVLAGKVAQVSVGLGDLTQYVDGQTRPADLETAMQLLHLRLTAPRKDERAFNAWKQNQLEWVRNRRLMPEVVFFEAMTQIQTSDHPRRRPPTPEMIGQVDHDKALQIYKDRFADASGMTFVFVGNIDPAKLLPLAETYLGSLPNKGRKERWRDIGVKYPTTKITKEIVAGTEPKSFVSISMSRPDRWSRDAERDARILTMVLGIRLREILREDMGGVYGVSSYAYITREPTQRSGFGIFFGCNPDNTDKLRTAAFDEVVKISKEGIGDTYLDKVREQLRREHETAVKENHWWVSELRSAYYFNEDLGASTDIDAVIKRVTKDNVRDAAKRFFDPRTYILGVMRPKK
jgi:zinc protease